VTLQETGANFIPAGTKVHIHALYGSLSRCLTRTLSPADMHAANYRSRSFNESRDCCGDLSRDGGDADRGRDRGDMLCRIALPISDILALFFSAFHPAVHRSESSYESKDRRSVLAAVFGRDSRDLDRGRDQGNMLCLIAFPMSDACSLSPAAVHAAVHRSESSHESRDRRSGLARDGGDVDRGRDQGCLS
jgi:hypothetical protein